MPKPIEDTMQPGQPFWVMFDGNRHRPCTVVAENKWSAIRLAHLVVRRQYHIMFCERIPFRVPPVLAVDMASYEFVYGKSP